VLEGRFGLFDAFLGRVPSLDLDDLGSRWETPRIAYKPYPACHYCHGALGAAEQLGLAAEAIDEIVVRVPVGAVEIVLEPAEAKLAPRTPYEAKFSLQYSIAALIVHGRVGTDTYTPEAIADPDVLALARRVRYEIGEFDSPFGGGVTVTLSDGRTLSATLPQPAGSPENPLADERLVSKFRDNARPALALESIEALEQAIATLEQQRDVRAPARLLAGACLIPAGPST
jgi:2-methylcitrate dehydratase PrpD